MSAEGVAAVGPTAGPSAVPRRQRNVRTRREVSEEPEATENLQGEGHVVSISGQDEEQCMSRQRMEELRLLQKLRKRAGGTSAMALADGQAKDELGMPRIHTSSSDQQTELMETFSKAKTSTDAAEDINMSKFVEQELARRMGKRVGDGEQEDPETKRKRLEAEMYLIPDEYKCELVGDTVVPGMTTVITEVPVSAAVRLKNIEEVEAMKRRLLGVREQAPVVDNAGPGRRQFVKTFGRNNLPRLTKDEMEHQKKKMQYVSERRPAISLRQVKKAEQKAQGTG